MVLSNSLYPVSDSLIQVEDRPTYMFTYRITKIRDKSLKLIHLISKTPFIYTVKGDTLIRIEVNHPEPNLTLYTLPIINYNELLEVINENKITCRFSKLVKEYNPKKLHTGIAKFISQLHVRKLSNTLVGDVLTDGSIIITNKKRDKLTILSRDMLKEVRVALSNYHQKDYDPYRKYYGHTVLSNISGTNPIEVILSTIDSYAH